MGVVMVRPRALREVEHELGRRTRGRVTEHRPSRGFLAGQVMVDDEGVLGERTHRVGEHAEPLEVADVEDDEAIDPLERGCPLGAPFLDVIPEQPAEELRPGGRVHDVGADPHLAEETRERRLRTAAIPVGIDVRRECDRHSRPEFGREPRDGLEAGGRDVQDVLQC
jgi:hypothetical protein